MTVSAMLQLKILRMKKRLFKDHSLYQITIITMGLLLILSFALRAVSLSGKFGSIEFNIPKISMNEDSFSKGDSKLNTKSVVVFLTNENIYFGTINSFGKDFNNVRNKFMVPHEKGKPDINRLIADIDKWKDSNKSINTDVLVFASDNEIPARIVLMTIAEIKKSSRFKKVVIGGGIL